MNKTKQPSSQLIVVGVIIVTAIFMCVARYSFIRSHKNVPSHSSSQESTFPFQRTRFPEALVWTAFNDGAYFKVPFSVEIPYTGPYCDCVDGMGGLDDSSIETVVGGFFDGKWQGETPAKWVVVSGVFGPHDLMRPQHGWEVPGGDFYTYLSGHPVGEEFTISDEKGIPRKTKRLEDSYVQGVKILKFQTDQNISEFGEQSRKFAIYKLKNYVFFLSFEYDQQERLYEGVFDHMISTLRFRYRSNDQYDKSIEGYFDSFTRTLPTEKFEFPHGEGSISFPKDWRVITPYYSSDNGRLVELRDNLTDWEAVEVLRIITQPAVTNILQLKHYVDTWAVAQKNSGDEEVVVSSVTLSGKQGFKVSVRFKPDTYFILVGKAIYRLSAQGAQGLEQMSRYIVNRVIFRN